MKPVPQFHLSLFISIYIGIVLNLPTYYRHAGNSIDDYIVIIMTAAGITASLLCIFMLFSLFGKTGYRLLVCTTILLSAAASYYMIFFNVVIGYGVIVSVLTTDTDLARESLGYQFIGWLFVTGLLPCICFWKTPISNTVYRSLKSAVKTLLAFILTLTLANSLIQGIETRKKAMAAASNAYAPSPSGRLAHIYLPLNWISATALFLYEKGYGEKSIAHLFNPAEHFTYTAKTDLDEVFIVVVIGETTRADHMGMLGYSRNTTPLLADEKNLLAFRGVSCDTATKLSLRCMFVRENGTADNEQQTLKEQNIFAVLKQLGFTSELFAMQSEIWFYNSVLADSYKFREIIAAENAGEKAGMDDMLLVEQVKMSLAKHPAGKHLIVLHTKGSHYLYSERHPREFARFTPECRSIDENCSTEQLLNSYDNSVLYVDTVMKRLLDELRDRKALLIYAADHGESIADNRHFHATPRTIAPAEQFRVPILFWASEKLLQSSAHHAKSFHHLHALHDKNAIVSHRVLFDSILGCLGYASPDGGIVAENNLCGSDYQAKNIRYPAGGAYPASGQPQ